MIPYGPRFPLSLRVQLSFCFFLALFLAVRIHRCIPDPLTRSPQIPTLDFLSISPSIAAFSILSLVGVMGFADAVVQGSRTPQLSAALASVM